MNPDQEENKIRELMKESRSRDEAQAPEFAKVWGAAVARAKFERRRRYFVAVTAIAASIALLGAIMGRIFREEQPPVHLSSAPSVLGADLPWESAVLICEWHSPTDFLLRLPGEQLLAKPSPGQSIRTNNKYE
jgi:hypothetical protein